MQEKSDNYEYFARRIKTLRGHLGGIAQVARDMGISRQTITECMTGRLPISGKTWAKLAMSEARHLPASDASPESGIVSEREQSPYGAVPASGPTRSQLEAQFRAALDIAERVPGGLGWVSVQLGLHLRPDQLRALDPAYDPIAELKRRHAAMTTQSPGGESRQRAS